jgi:hypothetical protein
LEFLHLEWMLGPGEAAVMPGHHGCSASFWQALYGPLVLQHLHMQKRAKMHAAKRNLRASVILKLLDILVMH